MFINKYYNRDYVEKRVAHGEHRALVGSYWDELGALQLDFLKAKGLSPYHVLLDIGCGSLRLGHLAVPYLNSGNYYGVDIREELIEAGYDQELGPALKAKLPLQNLEANENFDFSFVLRPIDIAIAQSLFTHLPLNHIRQCLDNLHDKMVTGGLFFATIFFCPANHDRKLPLFHSLFKNPTSSFKDPFHYTLRDMEFCAGDTGWKLDYIGDWNHPRGQHMLQFTRR